MFASHRLGPEFASLSLDVFRDGGNGVWLGFSQCFSHFPLAQISFQHFSTLISFISSSLWWCVWHSLSASLLFTDRLRTKCLETCPVSGLSPICIIMSRLLCLLQFSLKINQSRCTGEHEVIQAAGRSKCTDCQTAPVPMWSVYYNDPGLLFPS